ncbi:MAG: hypothetical protein WAX89_06515 [Alphaproteobacteria bacterium]
MSKLMPTGRVYLIGDTIDNPQNGDMRIMPPRDNELIPTGDGKTKYRYTYAEVRIAGAWLRYGMTTQKGLQHWQTDGGSFTHMRMHLFAAVLATIREPFELFENSVYAPADKDRLGELNDIADMLLYNEVIITKRKPNA